MVKNGNRWPDQTEYADCGANSPIDVNVNAVQRNTNLHESSQIDWMSQPRSNRYFLFSGVLAGVSLVQISVD